MVAAIELLVLPRFEANANKLFDFLNDYIENDRSGMAKWRHCTGRTDLRGVRPGHYDESVTLLLPRCVLVLHTATPDNWFLRLFESTGSSRSRGQHHGAGLLPARHVRARRVDSGAEQGHQAAARRATSMTC